MLPERGQVPRSATPPLAPPRRAGEGYFDCDRSSSRPTSARTLQTQKSDVFLSPNSAPLIGSLVQLRLE